MIESKESRREQLKIDATLVMKTGFNFYNI